MRLGKQRRSILTKAEYSAWQRWARWGDEKLNQLVEYVIPFLKSVDGIHQYFEA